MARCSCSRSTSRSGSGRARPEKRPSEPECCRAPDRGRTRRGGPGPPDAASDRLSASAGVRGAAPRRRRTLRKLGFANPDAAAANLESLTPTPRDAELLAPVLPRLFAELAASPDPDTALNNLEAS